MIRKREDFPDLTDDEFDAIMWYSVEGICDRCHKTGVQCYHILKLGLCKLNGDKCLTNGTDNMFLYYWRRDAKKILNTTDDKELYGNCTAGHFCMQCANDTLDLEYEIMLEEFGQRFKDAHIQFCYTKIRKDVLVLHVE